MLVVLVLVGATPPLDAVEVGVWVVEVLLVVGVDDVLLVAVAVTVVGAVAVAVDTVGVLVVELAGAAV